MFFLSKYNTASHFYLPVIKRGVQDFAVSADWTPAAGDVKISKDGGAAANVTNQAFVVLTRGNASAKFAADLSDSVRLGLTALPNAAAEASGGLYTRGSGAGQINQQTNGQVDINVSRWLNGAIPAVNVTGVPKVDVVDWLGSAPDALSSGKLPADLKLWLASAPASLSASGYVQSLLLRWLTDNAGGTPSALISGRVDASAGAVADKTGYALTTADKDDIVDRHWDEARSGHVAAGSFGQSLQLARSGTAQAGAAASITLDAGASAVNDYYKDDYVFLIGGTGAGQARRISAYAGSTKVASVTPSWATNPDATSVFVLMPVGQFPSVNGAGALLRSIGLTVAGNPIEGASVWLSTDAAGSNVIAGPLTTSSMGLVSVLVDAGSYYVWMQKDGYNPIAGQSVAIA